MMQARPKRLATVWRIIRGFAVAALVYFAVAYVLLPRLWAHHEHQPGLTERPAVTTTPSGIPGDPLNVGLVGDKADVITALNKAGCEEVGRMPLGQITETMRSDLAKWGEVIRAANITLDS